MKKSTLVTVLAWCAALGLSVFVFNVDAAEVHTLAGMMAAGNLSGLNIAAAGIFGSNLAGLFSHSSMGKALFKQDLSEKAQVRKSLLDKTAELHKALKNISTARIQESDKEIKAAEQKLKDLKAKRSALISADIQARQSLMQQVKANDAELIRQSPACLVNLSLTIMERINRLGMLTSAQSELAKSLLSELSDLTSCLDDNQILSKVSDIETRMLAGL